MQSRTLSAAIVVALVAAAVIVFVVLNDDDGEGGGSGSNAPAITKEKPKPKQARAKVPTIVVEGGEPVGGVAELEFSAGDLVRFDVESDVAEEVHVHGYELMKDVEPGKVARLSFPAEIEGGFEVELEQSHTQIAELTVEPG